MAHLFHLQHLQKKIEEALATATQPDQPIALTVAELRTWHQSLLQAKEAHWAQRPTEPIAPAHRWMLQLPVPIFCIDKQGLVRQANLPAAKLLDTTPEELRWQRFEAWVAPQHLSTWQHALQQAFGPEGQADCHLALTSNANTQHPLRLLTTDTTQGDDPVAYLFHTQNHQQEPDNQEFIDTEAKYKSILEHSIDGYLLTDEQGRVVELHKTQDEVLPLRPDQVLGHYIWDIYSWFDKHTDSDTSFDLPRTEHMKAFFQTGQASFLNQLVAIEYRIGQQMVHAQHYPFAVSSPKGWRLGVLTRNTSSLHQHRTEHLQAKEQYRQLFSVIRHGLAVWRWLQPEMGPRHIVLHEGNPALRQLFDWQGADAQFHVHLAQLVPQLLDDLYAFDPQKPITGRLYYAEELGRYLQIDLFAWQNEQLVMLVEDVSEQKRLEGAFRDAQQRLVEAQDLGKVGHWNWDIKFNQLSCSPTALAILGRAANSFDPTITGLRQCIHPDDRLLFNASIKQVSGPQVPTEVRFRVLQPDGQVRHVLQRVQVFFHNKKVPQRILGTLQDISHSTEVEQALVRSEQQLRQVFEHMGSGMVLYQLETRNEGAMWDMRVVNLNSAFEQLIGLDRSHLVGKLCTELFPWLAPSYFEALAQLSPQHDSLRYEEHWEGLHRYFDVVAYAIGADRRVLLYSESTQRKQVQLQLQHSKDELETIFNNAPVLMMLVNSERQILKINKQTEEAVGQSVSERSMRVGELLNCIYTQNDAGGCGFGHECQLCSLLSMLGQVFRTRQSVLKHEVKMNLERRHGVHPFVLLVSMAYLHTDNQEKVLVSVDDITVDKRIEEALLENEERYRLLADLSTEAIVIHQNGRVIDLNNSFARLFGYTLNDLADRNFAQTLFAPATYTILQHSFGQAQAPTLELEALHANGQRVMVELRSHQFQFRGQPGTVSLLRDISAHKLLQQHITQAIIQTEEKDRSLFARELHDGLGPLLSTAKIYLKSAESARSTERMRFALGKVEDTLNESIAGLREISNRLSPHILDNFGLKVAIEAYCSKFDGLKAPRIRLGSLSTSRFPRNIELSVYRILVELLNNTFKHAKAQHCSIELTEDDHQLLLRYQDDGIGFDPQKVLEARLGMGLFNIQNRVKALGGQTQFNPSGQRGFGVSIRLPLLEANNLK